MNADEIFDWCEMHGEDPYELQYEWDHENELLGNSEQQEGEQDDPE